MFILLDGLLALFVKSTERLEKPTSAFKLVFSDLMLVQIYLQILVHWFCCLFEATKQR